MSDVKMTDILVSTPAFIITFTCPAKNTNAQTTEAVLEITPIVQPGVQTDALAGQIFAILTADSTPNNRKAKRKILLDFVTGCSQKMIEEFWDSANWRSLQAKWFHWPHISCLLYDKTGNVAVDSVCLTVDIIRAIQHLEEALFAQAVPSTKTMATWQLQTYDKKASRRDHNRATHKYFLHHRTR